MPPIPSSPASQPIPLAEGREERKGRGRVGERWKKEGGREGGRDEGRWEGRDPEIEAGSARERAHMLATGMARGNNMGWQEGCQAGGVPTKCDATLVATTCDATLVATREPGRAREGNGGRREPEQRRPHRSQTAARGGSRRAPALAAPPRASGTGYGAPPCICPRTRGPCLRWCLSVSTVSTVSTPLRSPALLAAKPRLSYRLCWMTNTGGHTIDTHRQRMHRMQRVSPYAHRQRMSPYAHTQATCVTICTHRQRRPHVCLT
jgi:hypothetical protein